MLIIFDETGFIQETVFIGNEDRLKAIYESHGRLAMTTTETHVIGDCYVANPLDADLRAVLPRPVMTVDASGYSVIANGTDEVQLTASLDAFFVAIHKDGANIAMGEVTDGKIDFSADHPGTYTVAFTPPFPYLTSMMTIEAT